MELVTKNKVRRRYKETEVGVIPDDWEVKAVGEFAEVKGGKRLPLGKSLIENPTAHPYIRVTDMSFGGVSLDEIKYVPEDVFPAIRNYRIYVADIFVSVAGTLGIVGKIPPELDGANLTENADRITAINCDRDFLLYNLMSDRIQSIIEASKTVGAQPKLALNRIQSFKIAIPSILSEQRAIAEALRDVDALVNQLEKLIAKKRDLKQSAMHELLTGKKRLAGFSGEWSVNRLGEICSIKTGKKDVNEGNPNGAYPFFTCSRESTFSDQYSFDGEAILIAGNGEVGTLHRYKGKFEAYQRTYVLQEFAVDVGYLWHQLDFSFKKSLGIGTIGSSIPYIKRENIADYAVSAPADVNERSAISSVLSDMDSEIAALEQRRDKTRAIKQGMMQGLLTGNKRLI